jgi:hypothetical protein
MSSTGRFSPSSLALVLLLVPCTYGQGTVGQSQVKGQRIFTAGHSFHIFMPNILAEIAKKGGIEGHEQVGRSAIGGSRVIQHWDVADDKFKSKEMLKSGKVDVLTLSPIFLPDPGIENFAKLGVENNPAIRITVQEFWLPYERFAPLQGKPEKPLDRNEMTIEQLRKNHEPYFKSMDEHVVELNKKFGKTVLFVAPVGQAVIALREKIVAGSAPGIKTQAELFTDPIGHVRAPIMVLVAYVHYGVIYKKSPVGLPVPQALAKAPDGEKLNRLLQELAWEAVTQHPLSGVKPTNP